MTEGKNERNMPVVIWIKPGENLYSIAVKYGIDVCSLMELNPHIPDPYWVYPGQPVYLPKRYEPQKPQKPPQVHKPPQIPDSDTHYQQTQDPAVRIPVKEGDIELEEGYVIEPVVVGLTYPTSITFDDRGNLYVAEAGFSYGPGRAEGGGRILKVGSNGLAVEVVSGFRGPVTGITWYKGYFYAADGGYPGRIIRADCHGNKEVLVDGLPTAGDHYTSNIIFGSDGKMYFGVGTLTNSAVVGLDNFMSGWLAEHPGLHDIPPRDYVLRGINYHTVNPLKLEDAEKVLTGAFHPLGVPSRPGEVVKGQLKANGVIYRANPDGSSLEHFADGFRNPYAIRFSPKGRLVAIDQGYDARGSRPIANAPDPMWEVEEGGWYGFPDFVAGVPVSDPRFKPEHEDIPRCVLLKHPPLAGKLITCFEPHSAAMQFDFSCSDRFGYKGNAFVPLFGSIVPISGTVDDHPGHRVVRVDLETGKIYDFLVARRAHHHGGQHDHGAQVTGPVRPVNVTFDPTGEIMYLVDFGRLGASKTELIPWAESGILWKIRRCN